MDVPTTDVPTSGELTIELARSTRYTLTVSNDDGSVFATADVFMSSTRRRGVRHRR